MMSKRVLLTLIFIYCLLPANFTFATNYSARFCFKADVSFSDSSAGDYFTDNSDDQTLYGIKYSIYRKISDDEYTLVVTDYAGALTGCTPFYSLSAGTYSRLLKNRRFHVFFASE